MAGTYFATKSTHEYLSFELVALSLTHYKRNTINSDIDTLPGIQTNIGSLSDGYK
jgi:hypothetical protein